MLQLSFSNTDIKEEDRLLSIPKLQSLVISAHSCLFEAYWDHLW